MWYVYILRCADDTLYTGITTDLARRLEEHNSTKISAARYTRARQPVNLIYHETSADRSSATRREYEIKQLSRQAKLQLIKKSTTNNQKVETAS